jgi:hypothetical protein
LQFLCFLLPANGLLPASLAAHPLSTFEFCFSCLSIPSWFA